MTEPKYGDLETALRQPPRRAVPNSFKRALVRIFFYPYGFAGALIGVIAISGPLPIFLQELTFDRKYPAWYASAIIMLLIFLFATVSLARFFLKGTRLFANGTLTQGTVRSIERTNWRYRFRITVCYLNHETFYYAYGDDVARARKWQENKTPLRVFYNPEKPKDAIVLESIIGMNAGELHY
jgi:hypothetical protein